MNHSQPLQIVLASSSPRRRELIASLGLDTTFCSSDVDESFEPHWSPEQIVQSLSHRKALAVAREWSGKRAIVVGSDTIVVCNGQILGKPLSTEDAARMLQALQGNSHEVYTGIACIDLTSQRELIDSRRTVVHMKPLTPLQIRNYISTGEPMDKAGAYAIQGMGATFINAIEGDYYNVVGLSISLLSDMLLELGVDVLQRQ